MFRAKWGMALALSGASADTAIVVGDFRVQALSSTLLRVEPKGPRGFEDRTTLTVTSRDFQGVPIIKKSETDDAFTVSTEFYDVVVSKDFSVRDPTCLKPVTGQDYKQWTRSSMFPNGIAVSDLQACCDACDSDTSCVSWIFNGNSAADAQNCWPLSQFSQPFAVAGDNDRMSGCGFAGCSLSLDCPTVESGMEASGPGRSAKYSGGAKVSSVDQCCELCNNDPSCTAFVHVTNGESLDLNLQDVPGANCWPLSRLSGTQSASNREVGHSNRKPKSPSDGPAFQVVGPSGETLYDTANDTWRGTGNLLHWPSPLAQGSYALADYPRFFVPEWGTVPIPDGETVDPELVQTNGYDFRNNVAGDTYVFLLGNDLEAYKASRAELLQLAGECPLLPDFAWGTWFTSWSRSSPYTFDSASAEVERWEDLKLPLSVWALDMNWRLTDNHKDQYYTNPNTKLFPNFTQWFEFIRDHKLRTYFNDHPFPVQDRDAGGGQCSPEETKFRWEGLSSWMEKGLTFWWFDHNWGFSIPPPFVDNGGRTNGNWLGLDNAAWGSHVYYNAVSYFDKNVRDASGDHYHQRPVSLTKFGLPDWRPGMDPKRHAEHPSQHRFPVWWTGDGVNLQASIESMVDSGVHDFKPYVHSDCGGDYKPSPGDWLRWTAHCTYGSIHRIHDAGAPAHKPWEFDDAIIDTFRDYLNARASLTPSIIAAGQKATKTGHPLVARCDLFWPEHPESASSLQHLFLDDLLVAPIWDSKSNVTSRSVWIPPGDWEDAWDGSIVTGPQTITVSRPYEQLPMWHRRDGGFLVVTDAPASRIEEQDWNSLTLELFPSAKAQSSYRELFERDSAERTELVFHTDGEGGARLEIGEAGHGEERAWTVRAHLLPGQRATSALVDGVAVEDVAHLTHGPGHFPLRGAGAPAAAKAGLVAEIKVLKGLKSRMVEFKIVTDALEV